LTNQYNVCYWRC